MRQRHGDDTRPREEQPPLVCWFCDSQHSLAAILKDSILIAREERTGGPYHLVLCSGCLKECMIEESARGRWFLSPNVKIGLIDFLFARGAADDSQSENILKAISWFRDNEERRRYFFERDGDHRYSNSLFLNFLWPWMREPGREPVGETVNTGPGQPGSSRRRRESRSGRAESDHARGQDGGPRRETVRPPRLLTPHEILGVTSTATATEIKERFHRLAVQYHPDKVHHLGKEFQDEAHKRFVQLQEAYATLLRRASTRRATPKG